MNKLHFYIHPNVFHNKLSQTKRTATSYDKAAVVWGLSFSLGKLMVGAIKYKYTCNKSLFPKKLKYLSKSNKLQLLALSGKFTDD